MGKEINRTEIPLSWLDLERMAEVQEKLLQFAMNPEDIVGLCETIAELFDASAAIEIHELIMSGASIDLEIALRICATTSMTINERKRK